MAKLTISIEDGFVAVEMQLDVIVKDFIDVLVVSDYDGLTVHNQEGKELDLEKTFLENEVVEDDLLFVITNEDLKVHKKWGLQ